MKATHWRKILSIVLCICTVISILLASTTALAAVRTDVSNLSLSGNTDSLKVGDTFTVALSNKTMKVSSFTGGIAFDAGSLKCTQITNGSGYTSLKNGAVVTECSTVAEANANGHVGVAFVHTTEVTYNAADIITVIFQVKKAGSITVTGYEDSDGTDGSKITEGGAGLSIVFTAENDNGGGNTGGGGCYVATCVYGSYDCPEVWTLRRFRDETLAKTWYGRAFIHTYYAISPTIVKWFGDTDWFKNMWRGTLDKMVQSLNAEGVPNTPYDDIDW